MRSSKLVKDFQKLIIFNKVSYVLNKILMVICFYTVILFNIYSALLYKILKNGINGKFFNIIKSMYSCNVLKSENEQ